MLLDSIIIITAWFILACAYYFWGNLGFRLFKLSLNDDVTSHFARLWLGWGISVAVFSFIHLFFPINAYTSIWFFLPAFVVFYRNNKQLFQFIKQQNFALLLAVALLTFTIIVFAIQPLSNPDTGFYHLNTIRWLNEYAIVPGLGNLHTRLGFNQVYFVYCASIDFYPFFTLYAPHISTTFLWLILCLELILSRRKEDIIFLCTLHFLPITFQWLSSPTTDFASSIFQIISVKYFLRVLYETDNKVKASFVSLAIFIASLSVFIKLSNVFFSVGLILLLLLYTNYNCKEKRCLLCFVRTFSFIALFTTLWLIRGYIQTGYPLFPSSIGKINFDWAVDEKYAKLAEKSVYVFARLSEYDFNSELLDGFKWFPTWFGRNIIKLDTIVNSRLQGISFFYYLLTILIFPNIINAYVYSMLVLIILSILALIIYLANKCNTSSIGKDKWLIALWGVIAVSLVIWFLIAPAPRFSNSLSIILFCVGLLLLRTVLMQFKPSFKLVMISLFIPCCVNFYFLAHSYGLAYLETHIKEPFRLNLLSKETNNGLPIYLIHDGYWSYDKYLISTQDLEFNPNLRLRGMDYQSGFSCR